MAKARVSRKKSPSAPAASLKRSRSANEAQSIENQSIDSEEISPMVESGQDRLAMEIVRAIRRILRKTAEHSRGLEREFGLSAPQVLCLRAIADHDNTRGGNSPAGPSGTVIEAEPAEGGAASGIPAEGKSASGRGFAESRSARITVVGLAEAVHMPVATVSRILDRLEQAGCIQRLRGEDDRRRVHVLLTELGRAKLAGVPTPLHEKFMTKLRQLDPTEQASVLDGLQRVVEMMDAGDLDVAPVITSEVDVASQFTSRPPTP